MSLTNEQIIEAIGQKSVMEIVELIKAMEETFGVTAAAAVAAGPAAAAPAAEEQTELHRSGRSRRQESERDQGGSRADRSGPERSQGCR